jgi:hypothetical protein
MKINNIILGTFFAIATTSASAEYRHTEGNYNEVLNQCLNKFGYNKNMSVERRINHYDFSYAKKCASDYLQALNKQNQEELNDFLEWNPRYTVPGQSSNKCFGKPKVQPFEYGGLQVSRRGYKAWVKYRENMPNCFEGRSWDNRFQPYFQEGKL